MSEVRVLVKDETQREVVIEIASRRTVR